LLEKGWIKRAMTWLRSSSRPTSRQRALLAPEVSEGEYFFLALAPRSIGPTTVAFGGRERCDERYRVERMGYPFFGLEYVAEGEGQLTWEGAEPRPLRPGAIFAYGPESRFRSAARPGRPLLKYFVCFTGRGVRATLDAQGPLIGHALDLARHGEVREIFDWLVREGGEHGRWTRPVCDRLGELLVLKIAELRRQPSAPRRRGRDSFWRCKTLIDEAPERFATLKDLARVVGADPSGLNRWFHRYQGVSPYRYLVRRKMTVAARSLMRGDALVKEVAERLGYPDPYHFSRVFKAVHGIAPAQFMRLYASAPGERG
jgi:AraC-like DNA-binding protein